MALLGTLPFARRWKSLQPRQLVGVNRFEIICSSKNSPFCLRAVGSLISPIGRIQYGSTSLRSVTFPGTLPFAFGRKDLQSRQPVRVSLFEVGRSSKNSLFRFRVEGSSIPPIDRIRRGLVDYSSKNSLLPLGRRIKSGRVFNSVNRQDSARGS